MITLTLLLYLPLLLFLLSYFLLISLPHAWENGFVHHYVDANGESFPHKGEGIDLLSFRNTPTYMGK